MPRAQPRNARAISASEITGEIYVAASARGGMMSTSLTTQRACCIVVIAEVALFLLPSHNARAMSLSSERSDVAIARSNGPAEDSIIGAVGVVEITHPFACGSSASDDEQFSVARDQVEHDKLLADAARARLVHEHLRLVEEPTAMLHYMLEEEELQAERAQLRSARQELTRAKVRLEAAACRPTQQNPIVASQTPDAIVDIRMEFPEELLPALTQALAAHTVLVFVYADHGFGQASRPIAVGKVAWIESRMTEAQPVVVVHARVNDPLLRLRAGELVAVQVQLTRLLRFSAPR